MTALRSLVHAIARERAVLAGIAVAILQSIATGELTTTTAIPVAAGIILRFLVTPYHYGDRYDVPRPRRGRQAMTTPGEPVIHSWVTDCLPADHPLAEETVCCTRCDAMLHAVNNENMVTWVEAGTGNFCLPCAAAVDADNPEGLGPLTPRRP